MSDKVEITAKINGKEVPVSSISLETFSKIRDAEKRDEDAAPVFSITNKTTIVVKLTDLCLSTLNSAIHSKCSYITLDKDGNWIWGFYENQTFQDVKERFPNVKPLFK